MPNNFDDIAQRLEEKFNDLIPQLPQILGNEAVNFFLDNFKMQGWQGDSGLMPWEKRKKIDKKNPGRPILVKSGELRRSVRITAISTNAVHIGTDKPYGRIHNEGGQIHQAPRSETFTRNRFVSGKNQGKFRKGTQKGKGFSFKARVINMPKRQFIGNSKALNDKLRRAIIEEIKASLNSL
jgi:phage gpG-like protein